MFLQMIVEIAGQFGQFSVAQENGYYVERRVNRNGLPAVVNLAVVQARPFDTLGQVNLSLIRILVQYWRGQYIATEHKLVF